MRKSAFFLVALASFVGVLVALQVNRYLDHRRDSVSPISWRFGATMIPSMGSPTVDMPADFREAAKKVTASVVCVEQYNHIRTWFGQDDARLQETGYGSGVVLSKDGIIVTNNHVVEVANDPEHNMVDEVRVRLPDKRAFTAKVVGRDRRSDLAVLKIEAADLQPIEVGDSTKLEIGQWVVAVGNPLGFDNTVSVGVVSSLGRSLGLENSVLIDGIQTDAAINPGNSGGALTDAAGQLIGINSVIASENGGNVGIGFAIPEKTVRRVVEQILKYGFSKYAALGVGYDARSSEILQYQEGRDRIAELVGAQPPDHGIVLTSVDDQSAAFKAGMQRYDVLMEIDGHRLDDTISLSKILMRKQPGDLVNVAYWSHGHNRTAKIILDELRG